MPTVASEFDLSRDPRLAVQLADYATSASPVWLWSTDGSRILWANAVGAAIFGAANVSECATRRFDTKHPGAAAIRRLAPTLPSTGQPRLERLRGFGASFGRALTCVCSGIVLPEGRAAVLIVATEQAGPALPLHERVRRLFPDAEQTLAVFSADGISLWATEAAQKRLAGASTLSALGIAALAAEASETGRASGATRYGPVTVERLGRDASAVLVVKFAAPPHVEVPVIESAQAKSEPTPATTEPEAAPAMPALSPVEETPPETAAPPSPQISGSVAQSESTAERRHPLRFVWQMDADGRFVVGSDEFMELIGPRTTEAFGRLWSEIAAELKLDPENQVARAVATHETWSGIVLSWPVDEGGERLAVQLSGLPVFDRDRNFRGYRGFGVCRDIARINQLARARRERPPGFMAQPEATSAEVVPSAAKPITTAAEAEAAAASQIAIHAATVPPTAANVVQFRPTPPEAKTPSLSPVERSAFRELAQELTARLRGGNEPALAEGGAGGLPPEGKASPTEPAAAHPAPASVADVGAQHEDTTRRQALAAAEPVLLERIPVGVLIYRHDALLYANRHFLELCCYQSLDALAAAGGLDTLFAEPGTGALAQSNGAQSLSIVTAAGDRRPVEGRLFTVPWNGGSALVLILTDGEAEERRRADVLSLGTAEDEIRELTARLESFKQAEEELRAATREAQNAASAKADFLAKVSHEIRTPLNAITGFAEVMMAERFGPIGNERYREYLKDIHSAGMHLVSLLNDLLDLSKIETGQLDLTFANVSLNELTQQCVGIMQPQASRARIIIRTSLTPGMPQVVADERSLRQIVLNLLSNSIKFTGPGGQVIVSTAFADSGEAVLRVRDTGVGMSETDVEAALEPFRQTATAGSWGSGGTGLGLPLTKALAEANRAHFSIKSAPNAGTLIEVAFPPTRVVGQ
jgi:signal transduction histidine kinase